MNCNKVSHLLSAYMDGELLGHEHRLIHHHLRSCAGCQTEYEDLLQMKRLLAAMRIQEPAPRLAEAIAQRVGYEESGSAGSRLRDWRFAIPGLSARPLAFSPIVGLGVGLTFFGIMFLAHPAGPSAQTAAGRGHIELELADVARDEPPPHVGELTNGLVPEVSQRPVLSSARSSDDLPDFPLSAHRPPQISRSVMTAAFYR